MVRIEIEYNPGKHAKLREKVRRDKATNSSPMHGSWSHPSIPRVVLTADTPDFDPTTIDEWKAEGFAVAYVPLHEDATIYHKQLISIADAIPFGEKFALIAYGEAAAVCLDALQKPMNKLTTLVAFYPTWLNKSLRAGFPPSLSVQVHFGGDATQRLLYEASRDSQLSRSYLYLYPDAGPGFAEHDLRDAYSKAAAHLAWSRTLDGIRRGFSMTALSDPATCDVEAAVDRYRTQATGQGRQVDDSAAADKIIATLTPDALMPACINHVPTMTGGTGETQLRRFYSELLAGRSAPPDASTKLVSRTVGADRVVDEVQLGFTHTAEVPWMLPGVPPTGRRVEIAVVSVACVRGGRLCQEHVYWDQASALVQVGLLDPALVPDGFTTTEEARRDEVKRLPVVGRQAVRKVVDQEAESSNELIPGWRDR